MNIISKVQDLVSMNKFETAISELKAFLKDKDKELYNQILLISSQYKNFKDIDIIGLNPELTIKNKIGHSILLILDELEKVEGSSDEGSMVFNDNENVYSIPEYDEKLGNATSDIFLAAQSPYGTEGIVRRFEKGSIYLITKKGKPLIDRKHVTNGFMARVPYSNIGMCFEMNAGTNSKLGFPISDIHKSWDYSFRNWTTIGYTQTFEGGNIYFTERYGARIVIADKIRRKILEYEKQLKLSENQEMTGGILGYPITNEFKVTSKYNTSGLVQRFELGYIIDNKYGTIGIDMGFYDIYQSIGDWNSELGFPTSDDQPIISNVSQNKGTIKYFENGCMIWDYKVDTGKFIFGSIFNSWSSQTKKLGFPRNIQYVNKNFTVQDFEGGALFRDNNTGEINLKIKP